jgi:hypothetical protein
LLEADVEKRPAVTLEERCRFVEHVTGVSVSETTLSRLLRRMGISSIEEAGVRVRGMSSWAAWRALVAGKIEAGRFVFVDECSANTSLSPLYG